MKKIVLMAAMAAVCIGSFILESCTKDQLTKEPTIQSELVQLSENYMQKNKNSGGSNKPPKWLQVLGADLKGALAGGATGAGIGSVVPGLGTTAGTVIGAVAGGASASIEKASELLVNTTNNEYPNSILFEPIGNNQNKMNNAGLQHYKSINNAFIAKSNYLTNNVYDNTLFYNSSGNYLKSTGLFPSNWTLAFPISNSNSNLDFLKLYDGVSSVDFLNILYDKKMINKNVFNLLKPYFECLNLTNSVEDFVYYSIKAENIVSNLNIEQSDKQLVLILMATSRNGIQYWSLF